MLKKNAKRALMFIDVFLLTLRFGNENESFLTFILHCARLALSLHTET